MEIFDNYLPSNQFQGIRSHFINGSFPWYYIPFANGPEDPEHYYQLSHMISWTNVGKVSNTFDVM